MADRAGVRPSDLLGIRCSWCAFCVDEALYARLAARRRALSSSEEAAGNVTRLDANRRRLMRAFEEDG